MEGAGGPHPADDALFIHFVSPQKEKEESKHRVKVEIQNMGVEENQEDEEAEGPDLVEGEGGLGGEESGDDVPSVQRGDREEVEEAAPR